MNYPTFDRNGYPSDETLEAIEKWDFRDWKGFVRFLAESYSVYGRFELKGTMLEMATGGWSGNEDVMSAFAHNWILHSQMWESSHRGGMYRYDLRGMAKMTAREKMKPAQPAIVIGDDEDGQHD